MKGRAEGYYSAATETRGSSPKADLTSAPMQSDDRNTEEMGPCEILRVVALGHLAVLLCHREQPLGCYWYSKLGM